LNPKTRVIPILLSAALLSWLPAAASPANPLLSGYGGPGAGEQAIIGAALLNGAGHRSLAGGSVTPAVPGAATGRSGAAGLPQTGARSAHERALLRASANRSRSGAHGKDGERSGASAGGEATAAGGASRGGAATAETYVYPSALRSSSGGWEALGLSGSDLLLIGLVLAGLLTLGVLTVRIVRLQR
jgi:hypothetical protein